MARQCMRPGCDRTVAACLTYDTEAVAVWLDDPVIDGEPAQQVCAVHASTLTAPIGWTVTDRRPVSTVVDAESGRPSELESEVDLDNDVEFDDVDDLEVEYDDEYDEYDEGDVEVEPVIEVEPEPLPDVFEKPAARSRPGKVSPARDKPRGKLLDRAFEWTGPQHSVLTTGDPHGSGEQPDGAED